MINETFYNRNYLKRNRFLWYRKKSEDNEKYPSYMDCYVFTDSFFTRGCYIRPEFDNITQSKRDEIYAESHIVHSLYGGEFEYKNLPEELIKNMDKQLERADEFFKKVNSGQIPKLNRAVMNCGSSAMLYKDFNNNSSIIFVDASEILDPGINLLMNLMSDCCLSDEDEIRFYFDEQDEIVYVSWYEAVSKSDYWVMGIKPLTFKEFDGVRDAFQEITALSGMKFQQYKEIKAWEQKK